MVAAKLHEVIPQPLFFPPSDWEKGEHVLIDYVL
jgi:hypothetical protein